MAAALKRPLHEDPAISDGIRQRFARRALTMPEINRRQAMVPEGATVLPNAHGTAPGLYLEVGEQVVVLLPGPPRELEPMFDAVVRDHLRARAGTVYTASCVFTQRVAHRGGGPSVLRAVGADGAPHRSHDAAAQ